MSSHASPLITIRKEYKNAKLKILEFSQQLNVRLIMQFAKCLNLVVVSHLQPISRDKWCYLFDS